MRWIGNHSHFYDNITHQNINRALLVSWLLKDLGWMITNVYLGWIFGGIAVFLHIFVLIMDWPYNVTFRFYHCSLVLWIIGNFMWMSVEFMVYKESSDVHFGPHTPVGGISMKTGDTLTVAKSYFFLAGIAIQLLLFGCINMGWLDMPVDEDVEGGVRLGDDVAMLDDVSEHGSASTEDEDGGAPGRDSEALPPLSDPLTEHPLGFTLTFIENSYIVLWICKDYFWSWATGDFEVDRRAGYFTGKHPAPTQPSNT
jgi:hypothetical protein